MDEAVFWNRLEFRICRELERQSEKELRGIWCDGIAPDRFIPEGRPRIEGTAWMGVDGQERWKFTLFVGRRVNSTGELDWDRLLPPEEVSGWLSLDLGRRTVVIDPTSRKLPIRVPP